MAHQVTETSDLKRNPQNDKLGPSALFVALDAFIQCAVFTLMCHLGFLSISLQRNLHRSIPKAAFAAASYSTSVVYSLIGKQYLLHFLG